MTSGPGGPGGAGRREGERVPFPPTFWRLVDDTARVHPDRVLVVDDHGRTLTAAQFRDAALTCAAALHAEHGVGPGTVVSWQLPTVIESLVLLAALARLDAHQNPIIPLMRDREVRFICNEVGTELFVTVPEWRGFGHEALAGEVAADQGFSVLTAPVDAAKAPGVLHLPAGDPAILPPEPPLLAPDELPVRWTYHTSGTTSDPKGVQHTDWSVMHGASALIERLDLDEADVYPIAFPVTHIGGAVILGVFLVTGSRLVLFDSFDAARSPARFAAHEPTILGTAVPFFNAYVAAQEAQPGVALFPKLRGCIGGGAPIPTDTHHALERTFGVPGVIGSWGLTEFPNATCARAEDSLDVLFGSVGRPGTGVEIRVVDADGADVAEGAEGELVLRGPQLMRAYANPALDAGGFFADPTGRWFRTGDLGRVDAAGNVWLTGRSKEIVIRNAENISVAEIENALSRHPRVVEGTIIGLPDARTGERVCAVVATHDGEPLTVADLAAHCEALGLARYKWPEQVELVDALPRNAMGKVRKPELQARFAPAPHQSPT